jgi:propanol-preferring alcohol dehydrogenase
MKACVLRATAPVESNPLQWIDVPTPEPVRDQLLIKVRACGVCRTDLHVVEGELPQRKSPVIPGHQVVGIVEKTGPDAHHFKKGDRVGVAWLHRTDGTCEYCVSGRENLCDAPDFTGYTVDGGYAEYLVAPDSFVYAIPEGFHDLHAAPLLCAGIIGFRCLRLSGVSKGARLGMSGFGAAAHVAIQVARHWGVDVYAFSREPRHAKLAAELGAVWTGGSFDQPPQKLDSVIIFAPAGELIPAALKTLKKGGSVIAGGIHMSPIPQFSYDDLYQERLIRSVANNTRQDGIDFLKIAAEIPIHTQTTLFPIQDANAALNALKHDAISGAAVLQISD